MTPVKRHNLISKIADFLTNKMTLSEIKDFLRGFNLEEDENTATFGKKKYVQQTLKDCNHHLLTDIATQLQIELPRAVGREPLNTSPAVEKAVVNPFAEITSNNMNNLDVDKRKVFVIYGRNSQAKKAMFDFLRSIDLRPLEWEEAVKLTGKASPYVGEVLEAAFSSAQAVVVLLTGDDEAQLRHQFRKDNEELYEVNPTPQARPNVIFEAGMAFGHSAERTILVQIGKVLRPFSDVAGRHIVHFSGSQYDRWNLIGRLQTTGCQIDTVDGNWMKAGDFDSALEIADKNIKPSINHQPLAVDMVRILSNGNKQVSWKTLAASPPSTFASDATTRLVKDVGEVWVTDEDVKLAEQLGENCSVELADATAASSPMRQYAIVQFIP